MHEELTPASSPPQTSALDDWKRALRADVERWLESLDEIPDSEGVDADEPEVPDLYTFYEQLAAATTEARKSNRRTAEAFSQWSETLSGLDGELRLLREQLSRQPLQPSTADDTLPRSWCLALIEITDRLHRLAAAFATPPRRRWLGGDAHWRAAWETHRQGFDILVSHVGALVAQAGMTRIAVLHQSFDPAKMSAVVAEPDAHWPDSTVLEEIVPGYLLRGELLRLAQVKVSTSRRP